MEKQIKFFAQGRPFAQGSKRAFVIPGTSRATLVESAGEHLKCWRSVVADAAREAVTGNPWEEPVYFEACFFFLRPKSHYRSGKNSDKLKDTAPTYHAQKPDVSKLLRAVEDACTGIVYRDDSQIFAERGHKVWSPFQQGVQIVVKQASEKLVMV